MVRTKFMVVARQQRVFHLAVWVGRAIGWVLLVIAIFGIAEARLLPAMMGNFRLLPSVTLGLVALVWIVGLELFLHFFDRYLSGN
jgi:hypothetical protein